MEETASVGFSRGAAAYRAHRPGYPPDVAAVLARELGLGPGVRVVDLAAGTGKSTGVLVATGADVVAIEPVAEMREQFEVDAVVPIDGTAEKIPLGDRSVDAVCVFQAFHWFDAPAALDEIARVLRPGGGLALVWNVRDRTVDWVRRMAELLETRVGPLPYERHHPADDPHGDAHWAAVIAGSGHFTAVESFSVVDAQPATVETVVGRAASTSFVAALDDVPRTALLDDLRSLVSTHPDLVGQETFDFPHRTDVRWCRRR